MSLAEVLLPLIEGEYAFVLITEPAPEGGVLSGGSLRAGLGGFLTFRQTLRHLQAPSEQRVPRPESLASPHGEESKKEMRNIPKE